MTSDSLPLFMLHLAVRLVTLKCGALLSISLNIQGTDNLVILSGPICRYYLKSSKIPVICVGSIDVEQVIAYNAILGWFFVCLSVGGVGWRVFRGGG